MSSERFAEWQAFYSLEPWGHWGRWHPFAMLASVLANVHRGKATPVYRAADFLPEEPKVADAAVRQSPAEVRDGINRWLSIFKKAGRVKTQSRSDG